MYIGVKYYNFNYMFKKHKVVTIAPSPEHVDYPYDSPWVTGMRESATKKNTPSVRVRQSVRLTVHRRMGKHGRRSQPIPAGGRRARAGPGRMVVRHEEGIGSSYTLMNFLRTKENPWTS